MGDEAEGLLIRLALGLEIVGHGGVEGLERGPGPRSGGGEERRRGKE